MAYQGAFDGLCGMYAIANAFAECDVDNQTCEQIFYTACSTLGRRRWPDVLWNGTCYDDIKRMTRTCRKQHKLYQVSLSYPFEAPNTPSSNKSYWERFSRLFDENEDIRCGIIMIEEPYYHWIVMKKHGGRVAFVDSVPNNPEYRKNIPSLYAGSRRRSRQQWRLNRSNLILFGRA